MMASLRHFLAIVTIEIDGMPNMVETEDCLRRQGVAANIKATLSGADASNGHRVKSGMVRPR